MQDQTEMPNTRPDKWLILTCTLLECHTCNKEEKLMQIA